MHTRLQAYWNATLCYRRRVWHVVKAGTRVCQWLCSALLRGSAMASHKAFSEPARDQEFRLAIRGCAGNQVLVPTVRHHVPPAVGQRTVLDRTALNDGCGRGARATPVWSNTA